MKKAILLPVVVSMFITSVCPNSITAKAESNAPNTIIEYYDNGYYAEITNNTDYSSQYQIDDVTSVKSGSKTYNYKDSSNQVLWSYTLYGTFSYNGSSASCTDTDDDPVVYDTAWHVDSNSCYSSGNTAYGNVTMKKKMFGITVDTVTKNITLSCSPTGTLS